MKKVVLLILGIIIIFVFTASIWYLNHLPKSLNDVIKYDVNGEFGQDDILFYNNGQNKNIVVQESYSSNRLGHLTISMLSYKGYNCFQDTFTKIDIKSITENLENEKKLKTPNGTFKYGTLPSDDKENMVLKAYISYNDYVFEFTLTNGDEQITEEQNKEFKTFLKTISFADMD